MRDLRARFNRFVIRHEVAWELTTVQAFIGAVQEATGGGHGLPRGSVRDGTRNFFRPVGKPTGKVGPQMKISVAPDDLQIVVNGELRPGIIAYGLRAPAGVEPVFP